MARTLVWFRGKDLRLADHEPLAAALAAAHAHGGEVVPLFVLDPFFFDPARAGRIANRVQFLLESLRELEQAIADRGSRLLVVAGKSVEVVPRLARTWSIDRIVAQRWVEPFARERDRRVKEALPDACRFDLLEGETLAPPTALRTGGRAYAVFTPFGRAFRAQITVKPPLPVPASLPPVPADVLAGAVKFSPIPPLEALGISKNAAILPGGETAARARLDRFLRESLGGYADRRDRLDVQGTSRLSADLKFGTLSAREVWTRVAQLGASGGRGAQSFTNELLWREFTHATLWDRPALLKEPFRADFVGFPWRRDEAHEEAWKRGRTGYPVVDAAARQLLGEGFVHNRARMIAASFLTKHLLIDYRVGEAHYLEHLTDGDWAQNNAGWQWSAGCGCDAQPYFRVFNPTTQGEKFDPEGDYVRRWVPELARVPASFIHKPWEAPRDVLRGAGVSLGASYPEPIVDHAQGRDRFLALAKEHLAKSKS